LQPAGLSPNLPAAFGSVVQAFWAEPFPNEGGGSDFPSTRLVVDLPLPEAGFGFPVFVRSDSNSGLQPMLLFRQGRCLVRLPVLVTFLCHRSACPFCAACLFAVVGLGNPRRLRFVLLLGNAPWA